VKSEYDCLLKGMLLNSLINVKHFLLSMSNKSCVSQKNDSFRIEINWQEKGILMIVRIFFPNA